MTADSKGMARVPDADLEYSEDLIYTYRGQVFTGIGFEDVPGRGLSEISYKGGLQDGVARDWSPSGRLLGESYFRENTQHGWAREFDEQGNVLVEQLYEYGILVSSTRRNPAGKVVGAFEIDADDPAYSLLERYRREKNWPAA